MSLIRSSSKIKLWLIIFLIAPSIINTGLQVTLDVWWLWMNRELMWIHTDSPKRAWACQQEWRSWSFGWDLWGRGRFPLWPRLPLGIFARRCWKELRARFSQTLRESLESAQVWRHRGPSMCLGHDGLPTGLAPRCCPSVSWTLRPSRHFSSNAGRREGRC